MEKEQIEYWKVKDLRNNPNNPRKNDDAVDTVAKSIEKYGFRNPLIIDESGVVWCGNTRLKASRKLGLKEVPCIVVRDLDEQKMTELALLDNKTNEIADWDYDMLREIMEEVDLHDFELNWNFEEISDVFDERDLDDDREKDSVVISITCVSVDKYNIIKEELQNLVNCIDATMAVKMQ